nr:hypothetical protein Itr_chr07CG13920 [Ipomoea trifida]
MFSHGEKDKPIARAPNTSPPTIFGGFLLSKEGFPSSWASPRTSNKVLILLVMDVTSNKVRLDDAASTRLFPR